MNSIFTNALPGENEDEHIYTLKELFNQNNNENNENNNDSHHIYNNTNNSNEIFEQRNISPSNKYKEYNSKNFKDSNNKMMEYNNNSYSRNRNNSKSSSKSRQRERERSRSRERERERSRSRERERESSSRKYSRSNSRNYRRTHQRNDDYRKRYEKPKNTGRNYQKPYSKFCCLENGVNKISTQFTVPEHLVSLLIGKNGENVKSIMHATGASVTFCKEVSIIFLIIIKIKIQYNDDGKINTCNGVARLCNLKGTIKQNMEAMGKILELVMKYETGSQQKEKDKTDDNIQNND